MSKHLQSYFASVKCFAYFDYLGSGANLGNTLIDNLEKVFPCVQNFSFKFSIKKCQFGVPKFQFPGYLVSGACSSPNKPKVEKFIVIVRVPKTIKHVCRLIRFMQYFQNFIPNLLIKLNFFLKLLWNETELRIKKKNNIKNNLENSLATLKNDLVKSCVISLKLAEPDCQFLIVFDASLYATDLIFLIEDNLESEQSMKDKTYAICFFWPLFVFSSI